MPKTAEKPEKPKAAKREAAVLIYSTFPNAEAAGDAARKLVAKHLVACVNIVEGVRSYYWWDNQVTESHEVLALFKTTRKAAEGVQQAIRAHHPYTAPAIVTLAIKDGDPEYLSWIAATIKGKATEHALKKARKAGKKTKKRLAKPLVLADTITERPARRRQPE